MFFTFIAMDKSPLLKIFTDRNIVAKVQDKLPKLFAIAELECSRAGKIGMEVGSLREQILVALIVHVFGADKVVTDIPITKYEEDVIVNRRPISIKTITGNGGVKVVWTLDAQKAREFCRNYNPSCDMLLAVISWDNNPKIRSGLFFISKSIQEKVLTNLGKEKYLKLPKVGTNPRGVEISRTAIVEMLNNKNIYHIPIAWKKENLIHKTYKRWLDLWEE